MAKQGEKLFFRVVVSDLDVDLETVSLALGTWDDVQQGLLNTLFANATSIHFHSVSGSIPLQNEATYSEAKGVVYSGGDKEAIITTTMIAQRLDKQAADRVKVEGVDGLKKNIYFYDPDTKFVKKFVQSLIDVNFEGKGGSAEICTITSEVKGGRSVITQDKTLL